VDDRLPWYKPNVKRGVPGQGQGQESIKSCESADSGSMARWIKWRTTTSRVIRLSA